MSVVPLYSITRNTLLCTPLTPNFYGQKQGEPERQPLLEPPGGNNQAPPEVIS